MFHRGLSAAAFPVSPNPNHALKFDASVLQLGDHDQGHVDVRFSDLTLFVDENRELASSSLCAKVGPGKPGADLARPG